MLIKKKDLRNKDIAQLESLLKENITPEQKYEIETELSNLKKGEQGELDSAYYIDFYYSKTQKTAVIHDIRIEHNGQVAQIDHLMINGVLAFHIIESKNYSSQVKINSVGEFEIYNHRQNRYIGIPSPIEQTNRQIHILQQFIKDKGILPKKGGMRLNATYQGFILFSPQSVIERPEPKEFNTDIVVKADVFKTAREKFMGKQADKQILSNFIDIGKFLLLSSEEIKEVAEKIVSYHSPKPINYRQKFQIYSSQSLSSQNKVEKSTSDLSVNVDKVETPKPIIKKPKPVIKKKS